MRRSIILTGPMGSGKTSVGKILAARLKYTFMDLDARIVEQAGKSINQLFADEGEDAFRDRESAALSDLVGQPLMVLSTGGGVVIREGNRTLLHEAGLVVNLTASIDELAGRLEQADDRPLLRGENSMKERITHILSVREPFYADADIRIDTTGKTLEDVAAVILEFYAEKCSGAL